VWLGKQYLRQTDKMESKIETTKYVVAAPPPAKDADEWTAKHGPH
jgi:hypothetical protein